MEDEWEANLPWKTTAPDWCPSGVTGTRWLQRLYQSATVKHNSTCKTVDHIGGNHDGGKVVCMSAFDADEACLVYSLGSGNNFLFELEMSGRFGCEVHTFDCTIKSSPRLPVANKMITYHDLCVGANDTGKYRTLSTLRNTLGHADRRIDVLKMDIERHEYAVVASLPEEGLPQQILFEVHLHNGYGRWGRPVLRREWRALWERLWHLNYTTFSYEPNPLCACCCEFSMIRAR